MKESVQIVEKKKMFSEFKNFLITLKKKNLKFGKEIEKKQEKTKKSIEKDNLNQEDTKEKNEKYDIPIQNDNKLTNNINNCVENKKEFQNNSNKNVDEIASNFKQNSEFSNKSANNKQENKFPIIIDLNSSCVENSGKNLPTLDQGISTVSSNKNNTTIGESTDDLNLTEIDTDISKYSKIGLFAKCSNLIVFILKIYLSWWSCLLQIFVLVIIYYTLILINLAAHKFDCTSAMTINLIIYTVLMIERFIWGFILFLIDCFIHYKLIINPCNWKNFFFENDVYLFRIETILYFFTTS
jgi:hypothetical protein